jgi:hypothetical protein
VGKAIKPAQTPADDRPGKAECTRLAWLRPLHIARLRLRRYFNLMTGIQNLFLLEDAKHRLLSR